MVLVAKFGVAAAFDIVYVSHADTFPILFSATALGFCNFFSRVFSALAPLISQMDEPLPMILFTIAALLVTVLAFGLRPDSKNVDKQVELWRKE